ncbi:MAG TPA: dTDP-4-dehydrorhamnose 3,5-epimerase [Actinomycetales bacterium]|jgi:dTDP-4-dehydrorhamnose 3,5-epimerase
MQITPLSIEGAWRVEPRLFPDERGTFLEWFTNSAFAETVGHRLDLAQSNISTSRAGTVRGIHFAQLPPSQAKYVTCVSGAVVDVVVDIRVGSPTYGQHELIYLDDVSRHAVYISEGLGHGYMALTEGAVFMYLCSAPYAPGREHGVSPLDPELAIAWPTTLPGGGPIEPLLSPKDLAAPTLEQAREQGLLPTYDEALAFRRGLAR